MSAGWIASVEPDLDEFAVATGHPVATQCALNVMAIGGNAVDAAVSAAFALFVLMPDACGLGGDTFALVSTQESTIAFNGSGRVPRSWQGDVPTEGAALASVPGAVAALEDMHSRFGNLAWAELLSPAISLARNGISVSPTLSQALSGSRMDLLKRAPDWNLTRWVENQTPIVTQPQLADTLATLATFGARAFYEGDLAHALIEAARSDGSLLEIDDLREHETPIQLPHVTTIGDWTIESQPPVSQAALVAFALSAVEGVRKNGVPRAHLLAEAVEEGFQWRPSFTDIEAVSHLPWGWKSPGERARKRAGAHGTSHTTSVSTSDGNGMVVSLLTSVFHNFGSKFHIPELGFFLNSRMLALHATTQASTATRPVHTLSPLIVRHGEDRVGIATPGADAQIQVLTQILNSVIFEGVNWSEALQKPRWRLQERALMIEEDFDGLTVTQLRKLGHEITFLPSWHHSMGAVTLAGYRKIGKLSASSRHCFAIADGRRGNSASSTA
jgi:gamma-glutamyltranspeptidase/glutathione hydrolase